MFEADVVPQSAMPAFCWLTEVAILFRVPVAEHINKLRKITAVTQLRTKRRKTRSAGSRSAGWLQMAAAPPLSMSWATIRRFTCSSLQGSEIHQGHYRKGKARNVHEFKDS